VFPLTPYLLCGSSCTYFSPGGPLEILQQYQREPATCAPPVACRCERLTLCAGPCWRNLLFADSKQQHKIRLAGIDAPESGQPFGDRAKQSLAARAFDRRAEVNCQKTDRCGRRVREVTVGGIDVGLEQNRRGMAWRIAWHEKEQSAEDRATYATAEIEARQAGRGLSRDQMPAPP